MNMIHRKQMWSCVILIFICSHFAKQTECKWVNECNTHGIIKEEPCYMISNNSRDYNDAARYCSGLGGTLAMMKNSFIQALIVQKFRTQMRSVPFWAGINDINSEGTFTYHDQSSLSTFRPWATNEPNNGGRPQYSGYHRSPIEDCVMVESNELWYDTQCSTSRNYACEFKKDHIPCKLQNINIPHAEYKSCYTEDELPYGEILPIKCHEGYILLGPNNVTCLTDEEWSPQPQCVKGCDPPKQLPHATLLNTKDTYTVGSQVIYICDDGYVTGKETKTHSQITCGSNSKWLPENSGCALEEKYTIGTMEVETGTSINLPCIVSSEKPNQMQQSENSYLWLKNSQAITNMDYSIDDNGTLLINNISENAVGKYICFQNSQQITPASVGFDLKLTPHECPKSHNQTEKITFREGASAILRCPHTSSDYDFTWFKDGQRYYVRNDQTLFPDGTLYTKTLKFSDQGLYTCQIRQKETLCERNYTTEVKIIASTESICGNVDPEYPHPWAVSLWQQDDIAPFCYGALIHQSWIVTTAQCLAGFNRKRNLDVSVRFGYTQQNGLVDETPEYIVEAQTVKIHPKFSKKLYVNDIGVLQLKRPVHFTRSVRPICLTETDLTLKQPCDISSLLNGTVIGWGPLEKDDYDVLNVMNESMSIVSFRENCFKTEHSYLENVICSRKSNGTTTTFAGDAGSPFEVLWKDQFYLLGIYSWGERAALLGEYDYFTKINKYVSWLKSFTESS